MQVSNLDGKHRPLIASNSPLFSMIRPLASLAPMKSSELATSSRLSLAIDFIDTVVDFLQRSEIPLNGHLILSAGLSTSVASCNYVSYSL
jgi:hypothetical protein